MPARPAREPRSRHRIVGAAAGHSGYAPKVSPGVPRVGVSVAAGLADVGAGLVVIGDVERAPGLLLLFGLVVLDLPVLDLPVLDNGVGVFIDDDLLLRVGRDHHVHDHAGVAVGADVAREGDRGPRLLLAEGVRGRVVVDGSDLDAAGGIAAPRRVDPNVVRPVLPREGERVPRADGHGGVRHQVPGDDPIAHEVRGRSGRRRRVLSDDGGDEGRREGSSGFAAAAAKQQPPPPIAVLGGVVVAEARDDGDGSDAGRRRRER
mmetsp:Transcript_9584/g.23528  ORF Transcript_9584/g.23528 Transcript_9584/m.23528 type:complete len:262 (-) Transcript_9584:147-932(-)